MKTEEQVIVKFVSKTPKLKYTAFYMGKMLSSSSNAQELGEKYAREYCTDWLLDDGQFLWSKHGLIRK